MVTVLSFMNLKYENVKMRQYLLNIFKWLRDNANPSFNKLCTARVNKALMTSSNKTKPTAHDVNQINGQQYKDICDLSKISPAFKSSWYFAFMQYINNSSTSLSIPTVNFKTWQICYRVRPNLCRAIWRISSVWLSELWMISWSWVAIDWRSAVVSGVNNRSIFIQQVYCVWLLPGQQQVGYSYWVASHAQRRSLLLQKFCGLCVCLCVSLSITRSHGSVRVL